MFEYAFNKSSSQKTILLLNSILRTCARPVCPTHRIFDTKHAIEGWNEAYQFWGIRNIFTKRRVRTANIQTKRNHKYFQPHWKTLKLFQSIFFECETKLNFPAREIMSPAVDEFYKNILSNILLAEQFYQKETTKILFFKKGVFQLMCFEYAFRILFHNLVWLVFVI